MTNTEAPKSAYAKVMQLAEVLKDQPYIWGGGDLAGAEAMKPHISRNVVIETGDEG